MDGDWQNILESLEDEIIVIGRDMRVRWANAAVRTRCLERGLGAPQTQPCHVIGHAGVPCAKATDTLTCPVPAVLASGRPARVVHFHPNGGGPGRYMEIIASPLHNGDGEIHEVVEVMRDVTEQHLARQALLQRNRELDAFNRVAVAVGGTVELDAVLDTALQAVLQVTELDAGALYLRQDEKLVLRAYQHISPEAAQGACILRMDDTACGLAATRGWPLVTHSLDNMDDPGWEPLRRAGLHTLIHIPLRADRRTVGNLCLGSRSERQFDDETVTLLNTLGSQIAVAIERARLHEELARKERARRALLRQVITAQEDERKRIARELHDEIMQSLTALLYAMETAAQATDQGDQTRLTSQTWSLAQRILDDVHNLIHDLRPTLLDNLGLFSALRWLVDQRLTSAGVEVQITGNGLPLPEKEPASRLPPDVEIALFRVLQEAISNIAEHARARQVEINFEFEPDQVSVTVEDDGIGFDLDEVARSPDMKRGLGLMGMWERMELVGGKVIVSSTPGEGTTLSIHAPLSAKEPGG